MDIITSQYVFNLQEQISILRYFSVVCEDEIEKHKVDIEISRLYALCKTIALSKKRVEYINVTIESKLSSNRLKISEKELKKLNFK